MKKLVLAALFPLLFSCVNRKAEPIVAPWGEVGAVDSIWDSDAFDLEQIQAGGAAPVRGEEKAARGAEATPG